MANPQPSYYLQTPSLTLDSDTIAAFEQTYAAGLKHGSAQPFPYPLTAPKWQFLNYLCRHKNVLMHGSGEPNIAEFEPRQSNDVHEFGNRRAVYAASDALWAMYFAIVNRDCVTSLVNSSFRVLNDEPQPNDNDAYYFFSIGGDGPIATPWRTGVIYVLPRDTFVQQVLDNSSDIKLQTAQWASADAVKPLMKFTVPPDDFPFLQQVRIHDPKITMERASKNPNGFPWLDA